MKGEILSIETTQYIQELKNTIESQSDIIQELQERIDKAIEYIEKLNEIIPRFWFTKLLELLKEVK